MGIIKDTTLFEMKLLEILGLMTKKLIELEISDKSNS